MPAAWTWLLCDAAGTPLAELATAASRRIAYTRNAYAEATFTISHQDDAADLLLRHLIGDGVSAGLPTLRCYRRAEGATTSTLRFNGYLAPFTEAAEDTSSTVSLVFRSPFGRLIGDGPARGRFTDATFQRTATDAGQIASDLITTTNAVNPTGLTVGSIQATKPRDRSYQFANVGEAIVNLTSVLDGFDFEEVFTEAGATFNVYARLGQDRPAAVFQYGPGTVSNVSSMSRTTQPPVNVATVIGANSLSSTRTDAASIAQYGYWPVQVSASDVTEQATLDDKAQALLRPAPVKTVEFTPEFGLENCPKPFDHFALGDTVHFYARHDALTEEAAVRVNALTVVIDDEGLEAAQVSDPQNPDSETTEDASMSVEVVG